MTLVIALLSACVAFPVGYLFGEKTGRAYEKQRREP